MAAAAAQECLALLTPLDAVKYLEKKLIFLTLDQWAKANQLHVVGNRD